MLQSNLLACKQRKLICLPRMKYSWKIAVLSAAVLVVAGCATPPAPAPAPVDPVDAAITKSSERGKAEPSVGVDVDRVKPVYQWGGVTVDYFGDASILLADMAKGLGMRFRVTGPAPGMPIYVRAQSAGEPAQEVLRRIALQFGGRADVVLRDDAIELRYRAQ